MKKIFYLLLVIFIIALFIYACLWLASFKKYNIKFGVSFSPAYATSIGLDWKETFNAILTELKPKYIRISAPWTDIEKSQGKYSYTDLDFMMNEAENKGAQILLVIGQKQPRWPECYIPEWSQSLSADNQKQVLLDYEKNIIERYKQNPALEEWQVENEPFINFDFGVCTNFNQNLVKDEVEQVNQLDPARKVVITDSGELSSWYTAANTGDILGVTLYRLVRTPSSMIWHYSYIPAAAYKIRAGIFGKNFDNFYISELQAEPWFSDGNAKNTPIAVQEQTMNPDILKANINYAEKTGASRAYFWGAEWWYFMKTKNNDSRYWDIAKETLN